MENPKIIQIQVSETDDYLFIHGLDEHGNLYERQVKNGENVWSLFIDNDKKRVIP